MEEEEKVAIKGEAGTSLAVSDGDAASCSIYPSAFTGDDDTTVLHCERMTSRHWPDAGFSKSSLLSYSNERRLKPLDFGGTLSYLTLKRPSNKMVSVCIHNQLYLFHQYNEQPN